MQVLPAVPRVQFISKVCNFLTSLEVANPESGKTKGCLLKEKAIKDRSKNGGTNHRPAILKEKSSMSKSMKGGTKGKVFAVTNAF